MAKRKEQPPEEGSPAWMSTFSDLMNLLLCFFVLLFASSTMDEGKIQKIIASFNNSTFNIIDNSAMSMIFGDLSSGGVTQLPDISSILAEAGTNTQKENPPEDEDLISSKTDADASEISDQELQEEFKERGEQQSEEMYEEVMEMAEVYKIEDQVVLDYNFQYVELDLNGSILFDSGQAEVRDNQKLFLQKVASILVKYKHCIIEIEGHTDNVPIYSSKYENNRDLSAARARKVYEYIVTQENFIDENIKIAGYGESKPIASNATEEGRAKNRRVSIKIYNQQNSMN